MHPHSHLHLRTSPRWPQAHTPARCPHPSPLVAGSPALSQPRASLHHEPPDCLPAPDPLQLDSLPGSRGVLGSRAGSSHELRQEHEHPQRQQQQHHHHHHQAVSPPLSLEQQQQQQQQQQYGWAGCDQPQLGGSAGWGHKPDGPGGVGGSEASWLLPADPQALQREVLQLRAQVGGGDVRVRACTSKCMCIRALVQAWACICSLHVFVHCAQVRVHVGVALWRPCAS